MYNVQYGAMSGKKIFKAIKKPADLYPLPTDKIHKKVKLVKPDEARQAVALESMKSTMQYREWQKKG